MASNEVETTSLYSCSLKKKQKITEWWKTQLTPENKKKRLNLRIFGIFTLCHYINSDLTAYREIKINLNGV